MACFATPFGLRYAAHCFNRAHAQQSGSALIPAGGKLGVRSRSLKGLVIVAGTNGSGKSRLLRLLYQYQNVFEQFDQPNSKIKLDEANTPLQIIDVIPVSKNVTDDRFRSRQEATELAKSAINPGVGGLELTSIPHIRRVLDRHFNASHQDSAASIEEKATARSDHAALANLVQTFLATELSRSLDGDPMIFGKPIPEAQISSGQAILLQLAVMLHAQVAKLDNVILLLDEPENHLHPAACNDMIAKLREVAPKSQLWVATHALTVIAEFAEEATLLFAENGKIEYAGSAPERILKTLVGSENGVDKIRDFTSLPSIYAQNRYAAECLLAPAAVGGGALDDQTRQIFKLIQTLINEDKPLRILDWGAGKGRLLQNLLALDPDVSKRIDYRAYDPFTDDSETCTAAISAVYGDAVDRYISNESTISVKIDSGTVDVVVMCNVLHEIAPVDWLKLFGPDGPITSSLSDNSFVLIVEDEEVPTGERAHKHGFIVFDTAELKALFAITETDSQFKFSDHRDDGRLKAHLVPKACLARITPESRVKALEKRRACASSKIAELRNGNPDYKNGRRLGFWLQQYANSSLALEEL